MMDDGWMAIYMEVDVVVKSRYYHGISVEDSRKYYENLSKCSRCPDQDSNREPPERKSTIILLRQSI
jgi:hypothetical protein